MIYFLIFIFVEVMVSSWFAGYLGGFVTFLELIVSAVVGIYLLQGVQYLISSKLNDLRQGQIEAKDILKYSMGSGFGAVLLIVPGFFTDIVGILLQFNFILVIIGRVFANKAINTRTFRYNEKNYNKKEKNDGKIIDVEVIDDSRGIGTD